MASSGDATPSSLAAGRARGRRDRRLPGPGGERRRLLVHEARRRRQAQAELQEARDRAGQEQALRDRDDARPAARSASSSTASSAGRSRTRSRSWPRSTSSTGSRSTASSPDFVLQGGDPRGDGTGGPGYQVVGKLPSSYHYKLGDVAMAKTQNAPSGAAGSQFFVISGPQGTQLPPALRPARPRGRQRVARHDQAHRGPGDDGLRQLGLPALEEGLDRDGEARHAEVAGARVSRRRARGGTACRAARAACRPRGSAGRSRRRRRSRSCRRPRRRSPRS